jgi:prepilin-type N-terminal cleavage/methylation domain-containing protein
VTSRIRLGGERGYSLVEMLTVMVILSVVLTGLTTLFVQGTNAGTEMNLRFQAQETGRLALDKMRREVHCASSASTGVGVGEQPLVTLTLPTQCPTSGGNTQATWCTVSIASGRWALYRKPGAACDATGVKWADYLTAATIFQYQPSSESELAKLRVRFPVDMKPGDAAPKYELCDQLVLRNSTRTGAGGTALPSC